MAEVPPNRILELRNERSWSVRDLADRCGLDHSTVHRLERGTQALDVPRMRKIAIAFGVKPSELLNDEDVEFRTDERGMELLQELGTVPEQERTALLVATREVLRVARQMAAQQSSVALGGDPRQVGHLAEIWNEFDHDRRQRAIDLWRVSGLTDR